MEFRGTSLFVVVRGDVDLASADALLTQVRNAALADPAEVIVDASEVTFIDCAGVSALIVIWSELRARGCVVQLVTPSRPVMKLLFHTGLSAWFGVEALANGKPGGASGPVLDEGDAAARRPDQALLIADLTSAAS